MHPVFMEALLHDRVHEAHRAAAARRCARLARHARRGHSVTAVTAAHPVAVLRSLSITASHHAPARHTGQPPRRAA